MAQQTHASAGGSDRPTYFSEFVEGRRGEILDAALAVFAEKGYDCGTMREIAAIVGVTEPALYRHYPGKEALLADLVALAGDRTVEQARAAVSGIESGPLRESLARLIVTRRDMAAGNEAAVTRTLLMAAPHNVVFMSTFRAHVAAPMYEELCEIAGRIDATQGIDRTEADLRTGVRTLMGLFLGYFMTSMIFGEPGNDEATVDAMLAIMGWS